MGTQKLCACDRTCQSPISAEIELVDTVKQPFAVIVKNLSELERNGLWLNPFRGIPRGPRLSRFDVIYLDENCQVLEFAENFTEAEFEPFHGEAASALILPPRTLGSFSDPKNGSTQDLQRKESACPLRGVGVLVGTRAIPVREGSRTENISSTDQSPSTAFGEGAACKLCERREAFDQITSASLAFSGSRFG